MTAAIKPALLLILDGWGHREDREYNAISCAATPVWDRLQANCPHALLHASGLQVGLPGEQMGNSEVGHINMGAGRVVYQNLTRIDEAIQSGEFFANPVLREAVDQARDHGKILHLIGLLSPGGIHSHEDQIAAMIDLAHRRGCENLCLHALLDGRDTPPRSAAASLAKFTKKFHELGCGRIATIAGRYYGMDRDRRWERVEASFNAICHGAAPFVFEDPLAALQAAYKRGESDEFAQPSCICGPGQQPLAVEEGDSVVFMNFRADRARELTRAFTEPEFAEFDRGKLPRLGAFVTLTEYEKGGKVRCAFPPQPLDNVLGEYLAKLNKRQLRIAETEKYAHVTFFFSGGREEKFDGESRILVPSPKVATYDLQPEMSAFEVTEELVRAIRERSCHFMVCNIANGDMVGHTGVWEAAVKAAEVVDECLGRITEAILAADGDCLITADHGNLEQMVDESTGQALTSHTNGPVPLIYVGGQSVRLQAGGTLSDVAPSILSLMGLPQPREMTGRSLVQYSG